MRRSFATPLIRCAFPLLIDLHILLFHLMSDFQGWFGQLRLILWECLYPRFHRLQHTQNYAQRFFALPWLIPIPIERRFQAAPTHRICSSFLPHFDQFSSLLFGYHA